MYFICSGQYHRNHWKRSALNRLERPVPPATEHNEVANKHYAFLLVYTGIYVEIYVHCFAPVCLLNRMILCLHRCICEIIMFQSLHWYVCGTICFLVYTGMHEEPYVPWFTPVCMWNHMFIGLHWYVCGTICSLVFPGMYVRHYVPWVSLLCMWNHRFLGLHWYVCGTVCSLVYTGMYVEPYAAWLISHHHLTNTAREVKHCIISRRHSQEIHF